MFHAFHKIRPPIKTLTNGSIQNQPVNEMAMPASIAAEMGEAPFRSAHYQALFAIGIVLFFLTLFFNLVADYISHKFRQVGSGTL